MIINALAFSSELFLKDIEDLAFKLELSSKIYETYCKRIALKITQKQLSKLLDISEMTIRRIENGKCYDSRLISKYKL